MATVVPELWRSLHPKAVPAVSKALVAQVFAEMICDNGRHILFLRVKVNAQRCVWSMFVHGPTRNFVAIGPLECANIVELWTSAESPGENQEPEANTMKGEKDRPGTPEQVIGRQRTDLGPLRKNVETRKKRGLINSVDNEMGFNSMPKPHQAEGKEITDDGCDVTVTKPFAPNGRE